MQKQVAHAVGPNFSIEDLAEIIGISSDAVVHQIENATIPRPAGPDKRFTAGQVVAIAKEFILREISKTVENPDNWLRTDNSRLGGRKPLELLDSLDGQQLLMYALDSQRFGLPE